MLLRYEWYSPDLPGYRARRLHQSEDTKEEAVAAREKAIKEVYNG